MNFKQIQQLIKFVARTGLADVLEPLLEGGAASLKIIRCGEKLDI